MQTLEERCRLFQTNLESIIQMKLTISGDSLSHVLMHPSYAHEKSMMSYYERLEFLGDSIINAITTTHLFDHFKDSSEGTLSRLRAVLISNGMLGLLAEHIQLEKYLLITKGKEFQNSNFVKTKTKGRAFEALLGALYLELGFESVKKIFFLITKSWENKNSQTWFDKDRLLLVDVKSRVQEKLHEIGVENPTYEMISHEIQSGQDIFVMALTICNVELARATGTSKKEAEKLVAKNILDHWDEFIGPLLKTKKESSYAHNASTSP